MNNLVLEIITPEGKIFDEQISYLKAPGVNGDFGVLFNHTPFFTSLAIGIIEYEKDSKKEYFSVSGGYCEVKKNVISILAETAEFGSKIDLERANEAKNRAEERLVEQASKGSSIDFDRARISLLRSINRIKVCKM